MFLVALGLPLSGWNEPADFVSGIRVPASFPFSIFSFLLGVDIPLVSIPYGLFHGFSLVLGTSGTPWCDVRGV